MSNTSYVYSTTRRSMTSSSTPTPVPVDIASGAAPGVQIGDTGNSRIARIAILAIADLCALVAAGVVAYALWALPERGQSFSLYLEIAPLIALFTIGYAVAGLYPGFGLGPVETLRRQSYVTSFGFLILAAFSFALKLPHLYSRVTFSLALFLSLIFVPLGRLLVLNLAVRWRWWSEPVVIIGTGVRAARAIRSIQEASQIGYWPAAIIALNTPTDSHIEGVPVIGNLECIERLAARGIRVALLEIDQFQNHVLVDRLQQSFRHVVLLREYDDLPAEGLQIRNLGNVVGIEYTNNLLLHGNRVAKRALDLFIGSAALMIAAPLILVAVALVRLIDGSPVLFTQSRSGADGRRIAVPKIRTMRRDAEKRLEEYLAAKPQLRLEWDENYKLKDDPRLIPFIGRLFRRFSVDELPQLWSVLRGDMSLVGPRPFPDYHIQRFSKEFRQLRQRVRPGITGLWQITVRSEGGIEEQQAYDSYYIRNWSVWLDIYVLSRTIAAVASGRGAY